MPRIIAAGRSGTSAAGAGPVASEIDEELSVHLELRTRGTDGTRALARGRAPGSDPAVRRSAGHARGTAGEQDRAKEQVMQRRLMLDEVRAGPPHRLARAAPRAGC